MDVFLYLNRNWVPVAQYIHSFFRKLRKIIKSLYLLHTGLILQTHVQEVKATDNSIQKSRRLSLRSRNNKLRMLPNMRRSRISDTSKFRKLI